MARKSKPVKPECEQPDFIRAAAEYSEAVKEKKAALKALRTMTDQLTGNEYDIAAIRMFFGNMSR